VREAAVFLSRLKRRLTGRAPVPDEIADRIGLLQWLVARNAARSYLEIGCNRNRVFHAIRVAHKVGVDPRRGGTHRMTSDAFFRDNRETFDLVFIDGLHEAPQVLRDVEQSLAALNPGGAIVLHDCNPQSEQAQRVPAPPAGVPWNGDVWKAVVMLRARPDLDVAVGEFDHGCGVVLARPNSDPLRDAPALAALSYDDLTSRRRAWLRLMAPAALTEFVAGR
jgi:SAM-dependent methyltransferase